MDTPFSDTTLILAYRHPNGRVEPAGVTNDRDLAFQWEQLSTKTRTYYSLPTIKSVDDRGCYPRGFVENI